MIRNLRTKLAARRDAKVGIRRQANGNAITATLDGTYTLFAADGTVIAWSIPTLYSAVRMSDTLVGVTWA